MADLKLWGVLDESLEDPADTQGDNYNHLPNNEELEEMIKTFAKNKAASAAKEESSAKGSSQKKVAPG